MTDLAFALLVAAVLIGTALAIVHARGAGNVLGRAVPTVHAFIGTIGLAVLIATLRHRPSTHAMRMGTAGFGIAAAAFIALAFLAGLVMASRAWRRKPPGGALIGIHAMLAIVGLTLVLAVVALD